MREEVINLFFQQFSCGFLDFFNQTLTLLGDETFFIVFALVFYWCVDKRFAFKMINVYLAGTILRTGINVAIKRPRPFQATSVKCIGEATSGYSFPSGHSHSAANLSTQMVMKYRKAWVLWLCLALTLTVMATRIYLGQHYLSDVLVGAALGVIFAFSLSKLFDLLGEKEEKIAFVLTPLALIVGVVCAICQVNSAALFDVCGAIFALPIGYYLEKKLVAFDVKGVWWVQLVKILVGAALVFGVKEGLKAIFVLLGWTNPFVYNFIRYAVLAFVAAYVVPLLFKATGKIFSGKKSEKESKIEEIR